MKHEHRCGHPACDTMLDRNLFACRRHWYALDRLTRVRILRAWARYQADPIPNAQGLLDAHDSACMVWLAKGVVR